MSTKPYLVYNELFMCFINERNDSGVTGEKSVIDII